MGLEPQTFSAGSPNSFSWPGTPCACIAARAPSMAASDAVPSTECGSVWPAA
jgi:hypothetical protein